MRTCAIEGCDRKHFGRGWCQMHHRRWYEHGDPLVTLHSSDRPSVCSVPSCERPHQARGYCNVHAHRDRRYGDPLGGSEYRGDLALNIAQRYEVHASTGCWQWTGPTDQKGYGKVRIGRYGPQRMAHRASYEVAVGPIPDGLSLDHLCGNTGCINPDHLEPVTHVENCRRGKGSKLSMEDARAIRERFAGGASKLALAREFGVSPTTIRSVVTGESWKEVA